uniref:uncharacterized protein n=1 Tax=Pristiophorus japonicus TaxID=55135 RepID=UPI00398EA2D8
MKKHWNQIAEDFCALVNTKRSGSQCKKKWQDLGQVVSKKLFHNKRKRTLTGGGPPNVHALTPLEDRVTALMGPAWGKTISTAQAGPTLEGKELEANPEDVDDDDSDADEPEENILQSNPPDQEHGEEGEGRELDEAATFLLNIEQVQFMELPVSSVTSGLSAGGTFHGFTHSVVAGPSNGLQQVTPMAPPSEAAGPTGVLRGRPRVRGRRNRPCSPEMQDATDVVQIM